MLLWDCEGSNNARHYIFKYDLQALADELGIAIRIAHYPPYTSKYNLIEHRLFPHVTRACQGVVFKTFEIARDFIAKTSTKTGLHVFTSILDRVFDTKRKVTDDFKENLPILFDDYLPQWNYLALPLNSQVPTFIEFSFLSGKIWRRYRSSTLKQRQKDLTCYLFVQPSE